MARPILAGYCPRTADRGPVEFAIAAGRAIDAPVIVVAVHSGGTPADTLTGGELAERPAELARAALDALRADAGPDVDLRAREARSPAAGLTAAAEEAGAGLLVLGSTARGAIGRVLPGSTAERVVHGAPCPVAVVPRGYAPPAGGVAVIGAAFAPTDEGKEALGAAAWLAAAAGATVQAIMVLDPSLAEHQSPGLLAAAHHERDAREDEDGALRIVAERELEDAIAGISEAVTVEPDMLFGDPADALAAASAHLDLLVMGSRAYGPLRAVLLGGVSRRVIARAACPVLVLPRASRAARSSARPFTDERERSARLRGGAHSSEGAVTATSNDDVHLRIDALQRRLRHLERSMEALHERLGIGPMPERPAPSDDETEGVRRLLAEGREEEALRLHADLTGQGVGEVQDVLESLRAGL